MNSNKKQYYLTLFALSISFLSLSEIDSEETKQNSQMFLRSKNKFQISVVPLKYGNSYYFNYNLFEKISFSVKFNDSSNSSKNAFKMDSEEPSQIVFNYPFSTLGHIETVNKSARTITLSAKYFPSISIPFFIGLSFSNYHFKRDRTFYFDKNLSPSNLPSYMVIDNTEIKIYKVGPTIGFHYLFQEYFFFGIESFYGREIARRNQYYPKSIIFEKTETTVLHYFTQKEYLQDGLSNKYYNERILISIYIGVSF